MIHQLELNNYTQLDINQKIKLESNEYKGEILNPIEVGSFRIYYININGMDLDSGEYSFLQVCKTLNKKGVDLICLIEKNVLGDPM